MFMLCVEKKVEYRHMDKGSEWMKMNEMSNY